MSTSTTAELFYGFTFPHAQRTDAADYDRDPGVMLGIFGSDGYTTDYVCAKASHHSVEIDNCMRLDSLSTDERWRDQLYDFCARHGIEWHVPAWYVAPLRI